MESTDWKISFLFITTRCDLLHEIVWSLYYNFVEASEWDWVIPLLQLFLVFWMGLVGPFITNLSGLLIGIGVSALYK